MVSTQKMTVRQILNGSYFQKIQFADEQKTSVIFQRKLGMLPALKPEYKLQEMN